MADRLTPSGRSELSPRDRAMSSVPIIGRDGSGVVVRPNFRQWKREPLKPTGTRGMEPAPLPRDLHLVTDLSVGTTKQFPRLSSVLPSEDHSNITPETEKDFPSSIDVLIDSARSYMQKTNDKLTPDRGHPLYDSVTKRQALDYVLENLSHDKSEDDLAANRRHRADVPSAIDPEALYKSMVREAHEPLHSEITGRSYHIEPDLLGIERWLTNTPREDHTTGKDTSLGRSYEAAKRVIMAKWNKQEVMQREEKEHGNEPSVSATVGPQIDTGRPHNTVPGLIEDQGEERLVYQLDKANRPVLNVLGVASPDSVTSNFSLPAPAIFENLTHEDE